MAKLSLEPCRVDQGDAFSCLSWWHIMSRYNFRDLEKKSQGNNSKALPDMFFSARFQHFFSLNLKVFLKCKIYAMSFDVLNTPLVPDNSFSLWSLRFGSPKVKIAQKSQSILHSTIRWSLLAHHEFYAWI